jgi:lipopolysaccharide export LptBFGC system permease protein LptF
MNRYTIISVVAIIAFMVSEIMIATAQEKLTKQINSTTSDKQKITKVEKRSND